MKIVNTHEAKTHLSRILEEVEHGEVYIISRNGKPIAELRRREERSRTTVGPVLSQIRIDYDPIEDLTGDEWGDIESAVPKVGPQTSNAPAVSCDIGG